MMARMTSYLTFWVHHRLDVWLWAEEERVFLAEKPLDHPQSFNTI